MVYADGPGAWAKVQPTDAGVRSLRRLFLSRKAVPCRLHDAQAMPRSGTCCRMDGRISAIADAGARKGWRYRVGCLC